MRWSLVPIARMLFIVLAVLVMLYASQMYSLQRLWLVEAGHDPRVAGLLLMRTTELVVAVTVLLCVLVRPAQPQVVTRDED